MDPKEIGLLNIVTAANLFSFIEETTKKVGFEFLAPLEEPVKNEAISKIVNDSLFSLANKNEKDVSSIGTEG